MTIGDRVKLLRQKKKMTQLELAEKLGYKSKSSVAHIENGRDIPRSMVVTLADILDTTPAYLMGWEDEKKNDPPAVILPTEGSRSRKGRESSNLSIRVKPPKTVRFRGLLFCPIFYLWRKIFIFCVLFQHLFQHFVLCLHFFYCKIHSKI